jgi:hypothetical protein
VNDIFLLPSFSISLSVLEISVVGVERLELNIIVRSLQEQVLLLFVSVDVLGGISGQLNE